MTNEKRKQQTQTVAVGAVLTALVILLQFLGSVIHFGPFSVSLVLLPIVIGAALCGTEVAAWLGFVFGVIVLLSGDAAPFMSISVVGTVLTVLVKGTACGLVSGIVYKALRGFNSVVAVMAAAIICPIVNTGIFLLGCWAFFLQDISAWGAAAGHSSVVSYMFLGLAGGNFLFELIVNLALGPTVVTLLKLIKKPQ